MILLAFGPIRARGQMRFTSPLITVLDVSGAASLWCVRSFCGLTLVAVTMRLPYILSVIESFETEATDQL